MFAGISQIGAVHDATRKILPPTPVRFPKCVPKTEDKFPPTRDAGSLVSLLQTVHRPADIKPLHFEALKIHVIPDASPEELIPDASFLPPSKDWDVVPQEELPEANEQTRKPLNNGNLSPGIQTYRERQKELLIDNTAAFRTIRRIPAPVGETAARLGNAYEFYKNLEFFSGYWHDTSIPPKPEPSSEETTSEEEKKDATPPHLQTHIRTGTGLQLPPDYRQNLLTAFVKLVAYDFGCNVSFPRTEPRLHLTPKKPSDPPSYFNSSVTFVYRTPKERAMARAGVVEGPVAALSARASTVFITKAEEWLDLAREVVAVLLTAQQRSREKKTEKRFGEGKWWTTTPRWGGGAGGPIGREGDKIDELAGPEKLPAAELGDVPPPPGTRVASEVKRQIGGINGPSPNKRSKKVKEGGNMQIYDNYRKMNPPGPTWDRKAKYMSIGKVEGVGYDDVFLVSALNHHICVVRARIPESLLEVLDGGEEKEWERVSMWRSKWFDMYLGKERVEAMELVWGMMAWLMRKIEGLKGPVEDEDDGDDGKAEKMDLS
ncbi:uncharacterized protein LY89DRAFT_247349 [Mollisia scopiformis]|uniref:Uncharacterized protein n=1 Tax=Mollisia scopiformis TaxID=149040 RepID=A0A194WSP6_MOLSC|nr:uncharacterized protein LY89DRAFT_247349 [Mollisia scopiformis]KUJ10637.1 hypothetical protein LY89DRAFT_247349 [Mollisia scopiformis]